MGRGRGSSIIDFWFDGTPEFLKMTPNLMYVQKTEVRASVTSALVHGWANLRVRCRNAPVQLCPVFFLGHVQNFFPIRTVAMVKYITIDLISTIKQVKRKGGKKRVKRKLPGRGMLANLAREHLFKIKKLQQTFDDKARLINLQRLLALWYLNSYNERTQQC